MAAAAANNDVVDDVADLIEPLRRERSFRLPRSYTGRREGARSAAEKRPRMHQSGDRGNSTSSEESTAAELLSARAAAMRRHAVREVGWNADIVNKINYIEERDAIVTWLDLIMCHQYGPRGF